MFTFTEIGGLIESNPALAADRIVEVMKAHDGNAVHTALVIKVHHATLKRWIARLAEKTDIKDRIESIRSASTSKHMSAEDKARIEEANRKERVNRELATIFEHTTPDQRIAIAKALKTTVAHLERAIARIDSAPLAVPFAAQLRALKADGDVKVKRVQREADRTVGK